MHKIPIKFWLLNSFEGSSSRTQLMTKSIPQIKKLVRGVGINLSICDSGMLNFPIPTTKEPFQAPGLARDVFLRGPDFDPTIHHHIFIPAIISGGMKFLGGAAGCVGCPSNRRVSVSVCDEVSSVLRKTEASYILGIAACASHEIAHVYGAQHNDSAVNGMMSSHLNLYNDFSLVAWPRSAKREVAAFFEGAIQSA